MIWSHSILRADMLGLLLHLLHQPGALDDVGEAGIILDVGGDGELAAGLDALDDDRRRPARAARWRRSARGARPEHGQPGRNAVGHVGI